MIDYERWLENSMAITSKIIKVTGEGSVNDLDAEAGFDLVIVDN